MTIKPIIFSAPMVRAILADRKTMTRRLLSYQRDWPGRVESRDGKLLYYPSAPAFPARRAEPALSAPSRYAAGDRLWVKETAYIAPAGFGDRDLGNATDTEGQRRVVGYVASMDGDSERCAQDYGVKKTPSIYMPRWASRLTLEVTAVRVERLQEITESDARAEGVDELDGEIDEVKLCEYAKRADWASNPWVACVTFKRVEARP